MAAEQVVLAHLAAQRLVLPRVQREVRPDAQVPRGAPELERRRRQDAQQAWAVPGWALDAEAAALEPHRRMTPAGRPLARRPVIRPPGPQVPQLACAAVVAEARPSFLPLEPTQRAPARPLRQL